MTHESLVSVDLATEDSPGAGGVVWTAPSGRDVNVNLVVLRPGDAIERHVNATLDVLLVVIAGEGVVDIDDTTVEVRPHTALLIPKGSSRAVAPACDDQLRYVTVHVARPPLQIGTRP